MTKLYIETTWLLHIMIDIDEFVTNRIHQVLSVKSELMVL